MRQVWMRDRNESVHLLNCIRSTNRQLPCHIAISILFSFSPLSLMLWYYTIKSDWNFQDKWLNKTYPKKLKQKFRVVVTATYHHSTPHRRHKGTSLSLSSIRIWSVSVLFAGTTDTVIVWQTPFRRIWSRCRPASTFFFFLGINFTLMLFFCCLIFVLLLGIWFGSPCTRSWTRLRLIFGTLESLRAQFLKRNLNQF